MKRRHFIIQSSQFLLTACVFPSMGDSPRRHSKKVIVIGAGVAGLSTAYHLKRSGFHDVVVLEAGDRIGGRVLTSHSADYGVWELGANWIHGTKDNPLADFCEEQNIKLLLTPEEDKNDFAFVADSLDQISAQQYAQELKRYRSLEKKILVAAKKLQKDQSLFSLFEAQYKKEKLNLVQKKWMNHFVKLMIEENYGASASDISAWQWGAPSWFKGGDHVLSDGYDQVPKLLSQNVDVHLQQKVLKIEKNKKGFTVTTSLGSWTAEQVIVTVPLGVLKAKTIQFEPPLPSKKRAAIESLGFTDFVKIFIRLKSSVDIQKISSFPTWIKSINWGSGAPTSFQLFNYEKYAHNRTLIGIAVSEEALMLQKMSEEEIKKYIHSAFKMIQPNDVETVVTTKWSFDPLSLGAYAYPKAGVSESAFDVLGESVGQLHFAGEACQSEIYGTVEAAFISGKKAAQKILKG